MKSPIVLLIQYTLDQYKKTADRVSLQEDSLIDVVRKHAAAQQASSAKSNLFYELTNRPNTLGLTPDQVIVIAKDIPELKDELLKKNSYTSRPVFTEEQLKALQS